MAFADGSLRRSAICDFGQIGPVEAVARAGGVDHLIGGREVWKGAGPRKGDRAVCAAFHRTGLHTPYAEACDDLVAGVAAKKRLFILDRWQCNVRGSPKLL